MDEATLKYLISAKKSLPFRIQEHLFLLNATGTIYWPAKRLLVVSDLHFEKASFLAQQGAPLPHYDTHATLLKLSADINQFKPAMVVCLGDSFHDLGAWRRLGSAERAQLFSLVQDCERWVWIEGNHDPELPLELPGERHSELQSEGVVFTHEPHNGAAEVFQVVGHFHPKLRKRVARQTMSGRCFAAGKQLLIMPAFGAYTGGLDVADKAFEHVLPKRQRQYFLLHQDCIYAIK
ncbi:ligase-associated DNA damage response endonuclease PdeM [Alteromonas flava]|uniref:ligase-associated DNA damage response endonuclease PdeM n=1 Tax=Alteromonas flava TaxID=2048003 RepID=UPI000C294485|nr:ligase-associated DNA damage response endonuclease PdeM [Alteromonas flava]